MVIWQGTPRSVLCTCQHGGRNVCFSHLQSVVQLPNGETFWGPHFLLTMSPTPVDTCMATCSLRDKLLLLQTSLTFSCWVPLSYQCVELGRSLWFAVYVVYTFGLYLYFHGLYRVCDLSLQPWFGMEGTFEGDGSPDEDKDEQCTQEFCPPYLCGGQGGEAKVSSLAWV